MRGNVLILSVRESTGPFQAELERQVPRAWAVEVAAVSWTGVGSDLSKANQQMTGKESARTSVSISCPPPFPSRWSFLTGLRSYCCVDCDPALLGEGCEVLC